ncbi:MAG: Pyruvate-formate lyase-activating enzyme [Thermoanaerobacterales bacterium 50_218]|nr:MAG: Pyruvate-formate lyase-activating enzyme [Thermoanaerobacterales bacterium 50_218]HAA90095.1 anaerobic ribonucleoside-triphosphate reductase activating protein [Peptococcaceae bacterium]
MKIGGFQKFSLIDYPEKVSAIIFTQGCNFRCPYCHNPELVDPALFGPLIELEEIFSFLEKRKGKIDAVVITGGEPTIQEDLLEVITRIKEMGYLIKLDTNGSKPLVLGKLIVEGVLDYIAMDVKAPLSKYQEVVRARIDPQQILESIRMVMSSGIPYEFRTTVARQLLSPEDILEIGKTIAGARCYVLQKFVPSKTLDQSFLKATTFSDSEFEVLRRKMENSFVDHCEVR